MRGVSGNCKFSLLKNMNRFETYFDIKLIYFTSIILGFYKHLDNLKKSYLLSWQSRENTRLITGAPLLPLVTNSFL